MALDFPELRIVCGHIGWPWTEEMIAVAWKHRNVWIDTSAHVPKHYPPAFVHFMKTFGKDKVCFATDYPLLQWDRVLKEVDSLELSPEVRQRFLHDNARGRVQAAGVMQSGLRSGACGPGPRRPRRRAQSRGACPGSESRCT